MKKMTKKAIAILLAFMLIVPMFAGVVFATGEDEAVKEETAMNETVVEQEESPSDIEVQDTPAVSSE